MNNIISLSGGKDSTAMLHMMLERGANIEAVVFFDTGWEFPQMYDHIDLVEQKTGLKIWRLHPRIPFDYMMMLKPVKAKPENGGGYFIGNGWPSPTRRWCTREKVRSIEFLSKNYANPIQCIGFASDEKHRIKDNSKYPKRYPLIEYDITEAEALKYCYSLGYHWDCLYDHFDRVSCYCCPLQGLNDLRAIRREFPDLWNKMLKMDAANNRWGFKDDKSLHHIDKRFSEEDRQLPLFENFNSPAVIGQS